MMNTEYAVYGKDIVKKYKHFELNVPELKIPKGFATALIGENGAGKSTLLNIMSGLKLDYQGEIGYFENREPVTKPEIANQLGYTGPDNFFLPNWTVAQVKEMSELLFDQFDPDYFEKFCKALNLPSDRKKTVKSLSDGNKMKLMLATAFCRKTKMLLLDEPASPLDPLMRDRLNELIREYLSVGEGERSVLFSTHNIADMESVTDYAIIVENGNIVEEGFVEELKEKYIVVKGDKEDEDAAIKYLLGSTKSSYGFEGVALTSDLDKLAGLNLAYEAPTLSQISVAIMKKNTKLTVM